MPQCVCSFYETQKYKSLYSLAYINFGIAKHLSTENTYPNLANFESPDVLHDSCSRCFFSNSGDLLFFSGAGELGSRGGVGLGWEGGRRGRWPGLEGLPWEAAARQWAADRAGGEAPAAAPEPRGWRMAVGGIGGGGISPRREERGEGGGGGRPGGPRRRR
ncbi:hypothetical protein [Oryza sativa Japonica Group]|uniref:Uncharacterized protein n=2 Tax=Oryza sativa subsp. japonica TaxID=39947 RepID=Q5VQT2_ORYSJ|nr:hypothetical protein [Oryza sativa Japonica Group]BAD68326.1 hypothetical protein [Oryza sativa Japonica Group]